MTNVVNNLREKGLSYDLISEVCGENYSSICNFAADTGHLPEFAVDKLKRLDIALNASTKENAGSIFEKHWILKSFEGEGTAATSLSTLWANGIISDEELTDVINSTDSEVRIEDIALQYADDATIPLDEITGFWVASPPDYLEFRKLLPELIKA